MNTKYTEEEESFLLWFKDHSKNILIGIIIGLSLILSFKYYDDSQSNLNHNLSLQYQNVIEKYNNGNNDLLLKKADEFSLNYPDNIYTNLLNLYAAKIYYDNNNNTKSLSSLDFVINHVNSPNIKMIAQVRKCRVLISENKHDQAYNYIMSIDNHPSNPLFLELLGDIHYKNNKIDLAREFYVKTLTFNLPPNKQKVINNKINSIK
tara:strand:+ start:683 stop:1300 length:618 start_codon:yes stop_codon:yes gene_type:complete